MRLVVLLPRRPHQQYQLLGPVETIGPTRAAARSGIQVRAALRGGDAVVEVRTEKVPGLRSHRWRASGIAIRAVDTAGRSQLCEKGFEAVVKSKFPKALCICSIPLIVYLLMWYLDSDSSASNLVALSLLAVPPVACLLSLRILLWPRLMRPTALACFLASVTPFCAVLGVELGVAAGGGRAMQSSQGNPLIGLVLPGLILLIGCQTSIELWNAFKAFAPHLDEAPGQTGGKRRRSLAEKVMAFAMLSMILYIGGPLFVFGRAVTNGYRLAAREHGWKPNEDVEDGQARSAESAFQKAQSLFESTPDEAKEHIRSALRDYLSLSRRYPNRPDFQFMVSSCHAGLANIALQAGRNSDAQREIEAALEISNSGRVRGRREFLFLSACSHAFLGKISLSSGRDTDAEKQYETAIAMLKEVDPHTPKPVIVDYVPVLNECRRSLVSILLEKPDSGPENVLHAQKLLRDDYQRSSGRRDLPSSGDALC